MMKRPQPSRNRSKSTFAVETKRGASGCFGGGDMTVGESQMVFWEGPNFQKKSILSMQRHRHNGKNSSSFGRGKIIVSEPLGGPRWPHGPVDPLHPPMVEIGINWAVETGPSLHLSVLRHY